MKRWLSVTAVVVLCLALVVGIACGGGEEKEEGVKKLKFGIGVPLGGAGGAVAGIPFPWSLGLAGELIGEFTVGGERYVWDFPVEDNQMNIAGGVASAMKLIYEHHVSMMFQAVPDAAVAAAETCDENDVLLFTAPSGMYDLMQWRHCFSIMQIYEIEWTAFFDWLTKEHPAVKRVAITYAEDRMGMPKYNVGKACSNYYGFEFKGEVTPPATVEYYPVATKVMAWEPDLVIGGLSLFKAMWDMGYDGLCAEYYWSEVGYGKIPWDKAAGKLLIIGPHPIGEMWPEILAFAAEYEDRYGVEVNPAQSLGLVLMQIMTQALEKAGTVDDIDQIVEVLETETFDTAHGPIYFGGEQLTGRRYLSIWPFPIYEVVGPHEYRVLTMYTPEEVEAIANEVWGVR